LILSTLSTGTRVSDVRVAIFADVRLYRDGLERLLADQPGLNVVAACATDTAGVSTVRAVRPDVILMEAHLACSTTLIRELAVALPGVRVVAYGVLEEDREAVECAEAGVAGYVSREADGATLLSTITAVADGLFFCPPHIGALLIRRLSALALTRSSIPAVVSLTPREHQVLAMIHDGLSNKQIARQLGIRLSTVKTHVHHVLAKTNTIRRVEAALKLGS
jgi:two-component system, NarL family, nitrate/nitrite response regulator NarL